MAPQRQRDYPPARGAADHLRAGRRAAGPGHRGVGRAGVHRGRLRAPARAGRRPGDPGAGPCGVRPAVQPEHRPAAADAVPAAEPGRARAPAHHAPHRRGPVVHLAGHRRDGRCCTRVRARAAKPPLPDLPIQYADYAGWQREQLEADAPGRRAGVLDAGSSRAPRPPWSCRPTGPARACRATRGGSREFQLPAPSRRACATLARGEDATLFMVLLAALQGAAAPLQRQRRHRRRRPGRPAASAREIEPLLGFFINTLALRTDLSGDPTFRELLARVQPGRARGYAHQELPFERLVEELQPRARPEPLADLPGAARLPERRRGRRFDARRAAARAARRARAARARFDLSIRSCDGRRAGSLVLSSSTPPTCSTRRTIERMIGHLRTLLRGRRRGPDRPVAQLPMLHRPSASGTCSATGTPPPRATPTAACTSCSREQAARTPDAIAVVLRAQQRSATASSTGARTSSRAS